MSLDGSELSNVLLLNSLQFYHSFILSRLCSREKTSAGSRSRIALRIVNRPEKSVTRVGWNYASSEIH